MSKEKASEPKQEINNTHVAKETELTQVADTGTDARGTSAASSSLSSRLGDINRLRVSTNFTASTGVEKALSC